MKPRTVRFTALAVGLIAAACEQPQLTAPVVPVSAGVPRASVTEPVQLGSATLTAPSTGTVPVGSAPDSTWVMIYAAGQLKAVDSGACGHTPPNWPCTFPAPWTAYETTFPFTSGPVLVTRQVGSVSSFVPVRGLSADGEAVGLIPPDQAAEVLAQLVLNNPEAYNPNPPPTNPQAHPYIITGTYSVTADGDAIGDGVLGRFYFPGFHIHFAMASSGPNEKVVYIESVPTVSGPLLILINAGLQPSDPWYQAQVGPSRPHPQGCGEEFLQRMALQVPKHEIGHYTIDRDFWNAPGPMKALESAVEFNAGSAAIQARIDSLMAALGVLQAAHDSTDKGIQDCDPFPLPKR